MTTSMTRSFSLADKAYYVSEYLAELAEAGSLPPRTICEKYEHTRPPSTGLQLSGREALAWSQEIAASLDRRKKRQPRSEAP